MEHQRTYNINGVKSFIFTDGNYIIITPKLFANSVGDIDLETYKICLKHEKDEVIEIQDEAELMKLYEDIKKDSTTNPLLKIIYEKLSDNVKALLVLTDNEKEVDNFNHYNESLYVPYREEQINFNGEVIVGTLDKNDD